MASSGQHYLTASTSSAAAALQGSAKRRGCLLSNSQADPGRELTQPSPRLLAEPCIGSGPVNDDRVPKVMGAAPLGLHWLPRRQGDPVGTARLWIRYLEVKFRPLKGSHVDDHGFVVVEAQAEGLPEDYRR